MVAQVPLESCSHVHHLICSVLTGTTSHNQGGIMTNSKSGHKGSAGGSDGFSPDGHQCRQDSRSSVNTFQQCKQARSKDFYNTRNRPITPHCVVFIQPHISLIITIINHQLWRGFWTNNLFYVLTRNILHKAAFTPLWYFDMRVKKQFF